ncbi:hypothetical protein ZTR_09184 [Talaromyces verruculosus]|nr:hypothetical protein ZTR_09184 [Talaromyces verruculosus]
MYLHTVLSVLASSAVVVVSDCGANIPGVDLSGYSVQTEGHSGSTTTYLIECQSSATACPYGSDGATVVVGPSTVDMAYSNSGASMSLGCSYTDSTIAVCSEQGIGNQYTFSTSMTVTVTNTCAADAATSIVAASTGATATAIPASATGSSTAGSSPATATGGSGSASSSNAAMPQVTAGASWLIGGAAVAVALAVV